MDMKGRMSVPASLVHHWTVTAEGDENGDTLSRPDRSTEELGDKRDENLNVPE